MNRGMITAVVLASVAFILIGIAMNFSPEILSGFEALRTDPSIGNYTALDTVVEFGPTLIILGFVIFVGVVGFMGIKALRK